MRTKDILGALAASIVMGAASTATAQVITSFSVTLDAADPDMYFVFAGAGQPCTINPYAFGRYFETIQLTVASPGSYELTDKRLSVDGALGIYSGPFDPLSPGTNCVATTDDLGTANLAAGTYTLVVTSMFGHHTGPVTFELDGPAAVTVSAPAAVPTLSEWAMLLFGTVLAGGAALFLQRRCQTA